MISFNAKHEIVYRASRQRVGSTESRPGGERDRERDLLTQLLFWKWSLIYRLIHHIFIDFILICLFHHE